MERDRKRKLWKMTAAVSAGILVILAAVLLIRKYMPTGQKMSGYDYFKTDSAAENDSTLVILDNEILYDKGRYIDGRLYLQQSFVQDNVNMRFYYDKESNKYLATEIVLDEEEDSFLLKDIEKEGESVLIYVEDDGPGMTEEKVRELRTMAQSVSDEIQTTGIGLINVFRRMQLYFHGQVEIFIESTPYTKTVIGFRIPQSGLNQ